MCGCVRHHSSGVLCTCWCPKHDGMERDWEALARGTRNMSDYWHDEAERQQQVGDSTDELVEERHHEYGDFSQNGRTVSAILTLLDVQELMATDPEAAYSMMHVVTKLVRLSNTPTHEDSWRDVAGYARLMSSLLETEREQER